MNPYMNLSTNHPAEAQLAPMERRSHRRFEVQIQIELHEDDSDIPIHAVTSDISLGGCYIQMDLTFALGKYVSGKFWIGDNAVNFHGRVVTQHPQFGNGIMFLSLDGDGEALLSRYLETIPT